MKTKLLIPKTALAFLMALFSVWGWGQTTIAFNGAEDSGSTISLSSAGTWALSTVNSGTPAERIKTGLKSFQSGQGGSSGSATYTSTLITNAITVSGYSSKFVELWNSSISTTTGNGIDPSVDKLEVYVSNSTTFSSTPDVLINATGSNSNIRWGMSGSGVITANAGTQTTQSYSTTSTSGETKTGSNAFSKIVINIPDSWSTLYIKIIAVNNASQEFWCIDDLSVKGTVASNPSLSISGTASNGSSCANTANAPVTYTITNNGTIDATGVSVSSSDAQFALSALSSTTIPAGGSATFTSTFTPTSSGAKSSTLTVSSTTSGSNSPTYGITGTGLSSVAGAVTTSAATSIIYTGATLNANVTTLGTCPATTEKGFVYGTVSNTYGAPISVGTSVATGAYSYDLASLTSGTTYYYKAYLKDANGNYVYGSEQSFTTSAAATQIAFVNVPTSGTINTNISSFTIEARTASNSVDTGYSGTVTVTKASGTGNLTGTTSNVNFVNGVATFSDVKFDVADTYTLSAASGSFSVVTSGSIVIAPVYSGVGRFEKITSLASLTNGDYIIADANDQVMATNLITSGATVTVSLNATNNIVVNPSSSSVWNFANNNGSYTIQSSNNFNYLNYVSSTNLSTVAAVTNNQQKWNITYQSGGYFSVVNASDATRLLKYNSQLASPGFKAYTASTQSPEVNLYKRIDTTTWNGSSWSNGSPLGKDAIIAGNYSTTAQPVFTARNITIQNGAVLEITSGNTINGENIIVENGGNLIQRTGSSLVYSGTFTVQKTGASALNKYAFWASPVVNQNLTTIFGGTPPQFITEYNTPTNYFVNANTTSVVGKGYAIKNPIANAAVSFVGTPNNGNVTYPLNTASFGYNLVGNPYPSDLNLVDFYNANSGKIGNTFYFWDSNSDPVTTQTGNTTTNVGYATYNPNTQAWVPAPNVLVNPTGNVAKVAQGFFVQATNSSDTSLSFTNAMRTSEIGSFFNKNSSSSEGKYWLKLNSSYNTNNTFMVAYLNGASNSFDAYDSKALGTGSDSFYTFAGAEKLIIQGKGGFNISDVVPVGAKHFETGNFSISLTQKEGVFNNGQAIYLHDMLLGTYTNLQNNAYNFTANAGEITDRFEIVYQLGTLSTSETQKGGFEVYRQGDDFYVRNTKNIEKIEIFDAAGRKIQEINASSQLVKIHVDAKGFYIIKAKSAGKEYTKKITY